MAALPSSRSDNLPVYSTNDAQGVVVGTGGEGMGLYASYLEDATTINISRARSGETEDPANAGAVTTYLAEFNDGINVYAGSASIAATAYSKSITLLTCCSIIINKSF